MKKILFLILVTISCTNSFTLQDFDENLWKNDKNGCKGERIEMLNTLINIKDELLNKTDLQISEVLGKPDRQELIERSQKFFIYQISPGSTCNNSDNSSSIYLQIRFNALLRSNEVLVVEK